MMVLGLGCGTAADAQTSQEGNTTERAPQEGGHAPEETPAKATKNEPKAGPRFVERPADVPLQDAVAAARKQSYAQGRQFLVYVGAKWCEPCRYFHQAVLEGKLESEFPKLDLMEFDLDKDKADLSAAGYTSRLIPLFVKAKADGSASDQRHSGGIKGPKSVNYLTNKLRILLEGQPGVTAI